MNCLHFLFPPPLGFESRAAKPSRVSHGGVFVLLSCVYSRASQIGSRIRWEGGDEGAVEAE